MSIYSKKTLVIILLLVFGVSFLFYFITKKDNYDRDDLYENKISDHKQNVSDKKYGVASNNQIAVDVGEKILADGGNAVDAAMGVSYALAVTEPHSSGLGGGGAFLTYDGKEGETPKEWQYKDISSFNYKQKDKIGAPGFVRGIDDIHNQEGKMDRKKILNYVIPLAEDGFEIDSELERSLKLYGSNIDRKSPFFDKNKTKREGDLVKQPALAKTLKGIRDKGPDYFYKDVGKSISKQLDDELTTKDFTSYKSEKGDPVSVDYLNNKIYSASNPLGGTLMLQGMKVDEAVDNGLDGDNRLDYLKGVLQSRALMYRNRDIVNGKDSSNEEYLSQDYLMNKLNEVNYDSNFSNDPQYTSTTHFAIVDKNGKLASVTNTLGSFFGSGKYMKEGFYMNNSLNNFATNPSSPNYGESHKIPRSYTSPTIVVGPDYYMGIGTPGGNKIPTIINEVLINYLRSNDTLQQAIDKPRFYNDGGTVYYERAMEDGDLDLFKRLGFGVKEKRNDANFGSVQAVLYNKNDRTVEVGKDVGNR